MLRHFTCFHCNLSLTPPLLARGLCSNYNVNLVFNSTKMAKATNECN
jgi:hypothetical protein